MAVSVKMPKLGMMEGDIQLVSWLVKEGDAVSEGDILASVESQKITNDIKAQRAGTILKVVINETETVPIGTVLAILGEPGEDYSALLKDVAPAPAAEFAKAEEPAAVVSAPAGAVSEAEDEFVKASPVAKKLCREKGISLSAVAKWLGTSKRISGDDVESYLASGAQAAAPASSGGCVETALAGMRKTIADRMSQSSHDTAPVTLMRSCDITNLNRLRASMKSVYEARGIKPPSVNDLMMKAAAIALRQHIALNATFENGVVRTYDDINFNMAIAIDAGLITPVIKNVDKIGIDEISAAARTVSEKAKAGTLSGAELKGGTFTVTNLGMLGIEVSTPILNPPQVAILAFGTIMSYLDLDDEKVVKRYKTFFSLTLDHRVLDGYPGAQYLATLNEVLQNPGQLFA